MSTLSQILVQPKFKSQTLTASAGQSIFTVSTISLTTSENVLVLVNGVKQPSSSFTVDSSTQITLSENVELGDLVEVIVLGY